MSSNTKIQWTDTTWNPILGCSRVSAGCANCYAVRSVWRMAHNPNAKIAAANTGLVERKGNGQLDWTGRVNVVEDQMTAPLRWKTPRRVFVNSQSDLFHENVPDSVIDRLFAVMALCPQHTFQVLTKRPERMRAYMTSLTQQRVADAGFVLRCPTKSAKRLVEDALAAAIMGVRLPNGWPLKNVWLGVSVEDQETADERIPHLMQTPAAVRFVSAEPLLGPVDLRLPRSLDWVIAGAESGPGARPMNLAWARSIVDQCKVAGVPVFVKQMGEEPYYHIGPAPLTGIDYPIPLRLTDPKGGDMEEWPEDLRIRQFPGEEVQL